MRPPEVPLVKICGITHPAEAVAAVDLGADMIGLNFHPPSPRAVSPETAAEIVDHVRQMGAGKIVGVFVDLPPDEIEGIRRQVPLDLLQFHGDQGPADLAPFGEHAIKVIRIPRVAPPSAAEIEREIAAYPDAWGFLFDVRHPTLAGGSGGAFAWDLLAEIDRSAGGPLAGRPFLVAGGVTPGNVRRALADSRADGVDVASGVESAPGEKDLQLIERLIQEVRHGATASPAG